MEIKYSKSRMDYKHIASSIFGNYILQNRVVPGMKISNAESAKEKEILKHILDYIEQA